MQGVMPPAEIEARWSRTLQMEAALCAWEFLFDRLCLIAPETPVTKSVRKAQETYGYTALRFSTMEMVPTILAAYDTLGRDEIESRGLYSYDWDFVPAVVSMANWDEWPGDGNPLPPLDEVVRRLRAEHPIKSS